MKAGKGGFSGSLGRMKNTGRMMAGAAKSGTDYMIENPKKSYTMVKDLIKGKTGGKITTLKKAVLRKMKPIRGDDFNRIYKRIKNGSKLTLEDIRHIDKNKYRWQNHFENGHFTKTQFENSLKKSAKAKVPTITEAAYKEMVPLITDIKE